MSTETCSTRPNSKSPSTSPAPSCRSSHSSRSNKSKSKSKSPFPSMRSDQDGNGKKNQTDDSNKENEDNQDVEHTTLRDHLKAISYIDQNAPDPCLYITSQGIFECRVCFNAFANEKRYREHTKTAKHREFAERGNRRL